jgi:putative transposase
MDGKGRCMDNIFVERLWRSLKYEDIYLHAYASVAQARAGIAAWLRFYNEERLHQAHGYRTPRQIYEEQCPWGRSAAPNGSASPVSRAKSENGEMLTVAPRPTGINNNNDLEIENIAVTLRLAPIPMPSIDTAQ